MIAREIRSAQYIFLAACAGLIVANLTNWRIEEDFISVIGDIGIGGFFLMIGLDLRLEFDSGSITASNLKPILMATISGMVLPAILYLLFAPVTARPGWVVVVATDISIVMAVAIIGKFPNRLRVILLAIAVLDDLGGVIALASTSRRPNLVYLVFWAGALLVTYFVLRRFSSTTTLVLVATAAIILLSRRANVHPSLGAFVVGSITPVINEKNEQVSRQVLKKIMPTVVLVLIPVFIFVHSMVQLVIDTNRDVVLVVLVAKLLGKTVGVGGVVFLARRALGVSTLQALLMGLTATAALTVAFIGIDATLNGTPYAEPVAIGILGATAVSVMLAVLLGRKLSQE